MFQWIWNSSITLNIDIIEGQVKRKLLSMCFWLPPNLIIVQSIFDRKRNKVPRKLMFKPMFLKIKQTRNFLKNALITFFLFCHRLDNYVRTSQIWRL